VRGSGLVTSTATPFSSISTVPLGVPTTALVNREVYSSKVSAANLGSRCEVSQPASPPSSPVTSPVTMAAFASRAVTIQSIPFERACPSMTVPFRRNVRAESSSFWEPAATPGDCPTSDLHALNGEAGNYSRAISKFLDVIKSLPAPRP
jgi:hypothetical protein